MFLAPLKNKHSPLWHIGINFFKHKSLHQTLKWIYSHLHVEENKHVHFILFNSSVLLVGWCLCFLWAEHFFEWRGKSFSFIPFFWCRVKQEGWFYFFGIRTHSNDFGFIACGWVKRAEWDSYRSRWVRILCVKINGTL